MSATPSPIRLDRNYRTRDGRAVRVLCVDGGNPSYPVIALIDGKPDMFTVYGQYSLAGIGPCRSDLIEIRPRFKFERWCNVYERGDLYIYRTREDALRANETVRPGALIARAIPIIVEGEHGQGLEGETP